MEEKKVLEEMLKQCLEQEKKYQFTHLTRDDVMRLGALLVANREFFGKVYAAEIKVNGLILFTYYPEGASEYYRQVLARKHNTANVMEKSALRFYAENQLKGIEPASTFRLDPDQYQFRGGSFPIKLKDGCVVGSIAVAGMEHTEDHACIVKALEAFFQEDEA